MIPGRCTRKGYAASVRLVPRQRLPKHGIAPTDSGTKQFDKSESDELIAITGREDMRSSQSNYERQVDVGKKIFLTYDQEALIHKFHLDADEFWIYISYLNTPCRINRKCGDIEEYINNIWKVCREYSTVMTIYDLLCFHQGEDVPPLLGQWCAVGTFSVIGGPGTDTFTNKYASLFHGQLPELKEACKALGGSFRPPLAGADVTCKFNVTPFFPVLLQFWEGDEEFPPKLMLMWDRNTDRFLHFETTFFLQGDLLARLKNCMENGK